MPTYLAHPPPPHQRMAFMDALEAAGIDYDRQPDGYFIYLREEHREAWERVCRQFRLQVEAEPPGLMEPI
ncbi:MAG: hypothetical protein EXR55_05815 [Dehalococcoidia bacterium]|nr:hypothetical protein [Dehalococcoidia bacterium]